MKVYFKHLFVFGFLLILATNHAIQCGKLFSQQSLKSTVAFINETSHSNSFSLADLPDQIVEENEEEDTLDHNKAQKQSWSILNNIKLLGTIFVPSVEHNKVLVVRLFILYQSLKIDC